MDNNVFDLQKLKTKGVGQSFLYLDNFYSLILASYLVIYLSFDIINGNLLK